MKKSPPTPDLNAKAPRPRHISDEDPDVPTMDSPPPAPSDTSTGFDRGTAAIDQDYRSGLLPGSDDFTAQEQTENPLQGPPETFPQQDDPDQEGVFEQPGSPNHEPVHDPENETLGAVKAPADDADDQPGTDRESAPSGEVNAAQSMNTRDTRDSRAVDRGLGQAMDRLGGDDPPIDEEGGEGSPHDVGE